MKSKDIECISLIYEQNIISNSTLVVYEVQDEETARILYIKEFYVPTSKVSSFMNYLKKELSDKGYDFKLDESNPDGYEQYSAINEYSTNDEEENRYRFLTHTFTFIQGDIESIKSEYSIGIDSAEQLFNPLPLTEIEPMPIFNFIKDVKFENERYWPAK
jgi:hypothetical protein